MNIFNQRKRVMMLLWRAFIIKLCSLRLTHGYWLPLLILTTAAMPVGSETITIGKGVGKVWEGFPVSGTLTGNINSALMQYLAIVFVGTNNAFCTISGLPVTRINGYEGIQLAPGIVLIPQLTVNGYFIRGSGMRANFSGTIGIPSNDMKMQDTGRQMHYPGTTAPSPWCFHPEGAYSDYPGYFQANSSREIHYSGNWVLIADGSQTSADGITIPPIYIVTPPAPRIFVQIFPSSITLRVSTLECTTVTTTNVDFGRVLRNTESGTELAIYSAPITVTCTQDMRFSINANVNVQFSAISGFYEGTSTRLALKQRGGYITGEISNDITSSGNCNAVGSGLPFNAMPITLGNIGIGEYDKVFSQQITWRLCSGGTSLPIGPVDAAAEMIVTYN